MENIVVIKSEAEMELALQKIKRGELRPSSDGSYHFELWKNGKFMRAEVKPKDKLTSA